MNPSTFKHINCRNAVYLHSAISRFPVPDEYVHWTTVYLDYKPISYESKVLKGKIWADPDIDDEHFSPTWNQMDGKVNRKSHISNYEIIDKRPRNLFGRTGLIGRGVLGRWGPNHAADPIVTRWKRNTNNEFIVGSTGKKCLEMVSIQRKDNNMWAIPGGMVDPGEKVGQTLMREFTEEALNSSNECAGLLKNFFQNFGTEIYSGYVDDPRNTDNAWMETVAYNFHDDDGSIVGNLHLSAGDDAGNVKWIDIDHSLNLYASHKLLVQKVVERLNAHW